MHAYIDAYMLLQAISSPRTCTVKYAWQHSIQAGVARKAEPASFSASHYEATGNPMCGQVPSELSGRTHSTCTMQGSSSKEPPPMRRSCARETLPQHPRPTAQMSSSACRSCCHMAGKLLLARSVRRHPGQADFRLRLQTE